MFGALRATIALDQTGTTREVIHANLHSLRLAVGVIKIPHTLLSVWRLPISSGKQAEIRRNPVLLPNSQVGLEEHPTTTAPLTFSYPPLPKRTEQDEWKDNAGKP